MGESMARKSMIIIAAGIGIAVGAYLITSFFTVTGIFERKTYINFSEIPITLEEMARISKAIGTDYYDDGKIMKATLACM